MGLPEFEWHPESVPSLKLGLHITQIVLAFVVFALEISVFRDNKAEIVGNNGWTFGVCFLSIPAWIYLSMAPRFPRTRKLANPTVMAIVDGVYAVFWLSGFASQAAYNSANKCGGACGRSKGIVGLGFIIFLLFCATTVLSIYSVKYHEWNGRLPGYEHPSAGGQNIDPDKAAFSTNMHDEEAYAHVPMNDHDDHDDPYAPGPSSSGAYGEHSSVGAYDDHTSTAYVGAGRHPSHGSAYSGRSGSTHENPFRRQNPFDDDTEYAGAGSTASVGMPYVPPTAHEEFDHDEPVKFPAADYDRVTR